MNKPEIVILVGPPASGKSTAAKNMDGFYRISQDDQGKLHLNMFATAIKNGQNIVIDRMNFDKKQRERYLSPAKAAGYSTKIIVLHENKETCLARGLKRLETGDHPTVKTEEDLRKALTFFFKNYERPTLDEADTVEYRYPEQEMKLTCIVSDIDNTLSSSDHRQHILNNDGGKKNWKGFFDHMDKDPVNHWCKDILNGMRSNNVIVLCSARPDSYREVTEKWLRDNKVFYDHLFMRDRSDSRKDAIVKEQLLDFEILTRFTNIKFWMDDRKVVIDKIRSRGVTVLDCGDNQF